MVNIVSFIGQNLKWFIIAGILIGGSIVAYVAYTIYKSTSSSSNKPSESSPSPVPSSSASANHGSFCNDEMCFAQHSDDHRESFSGSKDDSDSDVAEPIESYSSIDDAENGHDE